jgi:hypothetical protein
MSFSEKFIHSNFIIKLRNWEYWPFGIIHLPVIFYYLWLSFRSKSFIFFSASNPGIAMGGMFGESKYDVLKKVPPQYVPVTLLIRYPMSSQEILALMNQHRLTFPVIFKPDLGERGFRVTRIETMEDIEAYLASCKSDFLIQELVDLPLEFGVFYVRYPSKPSGGVTSVVMKEMLAVTGDGKSSLQELILQKDRAKLQWSTLRKAYGSRLHEVLPKGENLQLVHIGNHCLGTKFLDGSHLINSEISSTFDLISKQIEGFYFGRFDIRCASLDDLYSGNISVMELNGCGAEPGHIYHPGYSLRQAVAELIRHWRNIFVIARENVGRGKAYTSFAEALSYYRKFKAALK